MCNRQIAQAGMSAAAMAAPIVGTGTDGTGRNVQMSQDALIVRLHPFRRLRLEVMLRRHGCNLTLRASVTAKHYVKTKVPQRMQRGLREHLATSAHCLQCRLSQYRRLERPLRRRTSQPDRSDDCVLVPGLRRCHARRRRPRRASHGGSRRAAACSRVRGGEAVKDVMTRRRLECLAVYDELNDVRISIDRSFISLEDCAKQAYSDIQKVVMKD